MTSCQFIYPPTLVAHRNKPIAVQKNKPLAVQKDRLSNSSTGLTLQMSELTIIDDMSIFLIPDGTIQFYPNNKHNLYKISVLEQNLVKSKMRILQWGSIYNEWVCSISIWANLQFTSLLSTVKKIPNNLSAQIGQLVQSVKLSD